MYTFTYQKKLPHTLRSNQAGTLRKWVFTIMK